MLSKKQEQRLRELILEHLKLEDRWSNETSFRTIGTAKAYERCMEESMQKILDSVNHIQEKAYQQGQAAGMKHKKGGL